MDMGLEFEYVSAEGFGNVLGAFGDWPVYTMAPIEPEKWIDIILKIKLNAITVDDLVGTDLEALASLFNKYEGQEHGSLAETFINILK